ncbi:cytochrome P450 [Cunninghamella echinulata]|nr:cytochrome P450 [Cunninghamella echinulata]
MGNLLSNLGNLSGIPATLLTASVTYFITQLFTQFLWRNKNPDGSLKSPWAPSPSSLPYIWNGLQEYQLKGSKALTQWANEAGDFFSVKLGQRRMLVLNNGPLVHQVLVVKDQLNSSKNVFGNVEVHMTDNGKTVFTAPFSLYWSRLRRSIAYAISTTKASWFQQLFEEQSEKLLHSIEQASDKEGQVNGKQLRGLVDMVALDTSLHMIMQQSNVDPEIMVEIIDKMQELEQLQESNWLQYCIFGIPLVQAVHGIKTVLFGDLSVRTRNFILNHFINWTLLDQKDNNEEEKEKDNAKELSSSPQFTSLLSNIQPSKNDPTPEQLQREDIIINLMHLTLHSHKYLSTCLFNIIQRLATLPEWQEKLIDQPLYAEAFVKECLRYDPPARVFTRGTRADHDLEIHSQTYRVDDDSELVVNLDKIHFDQNYYSQPNTFDPERFLTKDRTSLLKPSSQSKTTVSILDENPNHLPAHDHLAFGVGRRFCQGSRVSEQFLINFILILVKTYSFKGGNTDRVHRSTGIWGWTGREEMIGTSITFKRKN